jgi:hypothetical protein
MPGFPIRTPSDLSSVGSSPRLIAASYVLHRLLMPRHPPCALKNLTTKMLASTVQFSNNHQNTRAATANTYRSTISGLLRTWRCDLPKRSSRDQPDRVFSQDPTACRTPPKPPDQTRSMLRRAVLDTRSRCPSAVHLPVVPLVIEQPSSIRSTDPMALRNTSEDMRVRCSLERR